jgi:hypothetical protein
VGEIARVHFLASLKLVMAEETEIELS